MEILPTRYGVFSNRLHEIQQAIHIQKPLAAAALREIYEARGRKDKPSTIGILAREMQAEQERLHDLRQERNYLRNQMGLNRKGQPLPYDVLPPGICDPDILPRDIYERDIYEPHRRNHI